MKQKLKKCAKLFFVFFRLGAVSFGGGYAALPLLEREIAEKRKWATVDTLYDYYAIGQCTPGIIMVNVATFVGYTEGGLAGSVFATAGIVTPSIIVISLVAAFLQNFADIPLVKKAFSGINVSVAALLTRAIWTFGKKSIKNAAGVFLAVGAFAAMYFFKVNSVIVILAGALAGIALTAIKNKRGLTRGGGENDGAV
jgi:chromate transporter